MITLVAYASTNTFKDTMIVVNYDATADFNRMYHEYGNMLGTKKKMDCAICKCMPETTGRATRNVETGLGMRTITYKQKQGDKTMMGEIQGKENVLQG